MYSSRWENHLNSCSDLELHAIMPNIELVRDISIFYKVFKFHVPGSIPFIIIVQKDTQKHTQTLMSTL